MRSNTQMMRLAIGGLVGTLFVTAVMYYGAPYLIGHPLDLAAMLAGFFGVSWTAGVVIHFVDGTFVFPAAYVASVERSLVGPPWVRGGLFGFGLWLLLEAAVMPLAGSGFFSAQAGGAIAALTSLGGHLGYGIILGLIAGTPAATGTIVRRPSEPRRAEEPRHRSRGAA